jgi:hypothetical protein
MALSEEAKGQWRKRGQADLIILLDWNSTLSQVTIATPLRTLKDALFKVSDEYKSIFTNIQYTLNKMLNRLPAFVLLNV